MAHSTAVRSPAVAGTFYESDPGRLRAEVRGHLDQVRDLPEVGKIQGIVVPHAGHIFSGPPAAHAFRMIEGRDIRRVVLIGPSHHMWFDGAAAWVGEAFRTPLGDVPLDNDFTQTLIEKHDFITENPRPHGPEHSLEVELPFLQEVLPEGWRLTPLLVAHQDHHLMSRLGDALGHALRSDETPTLIVASSDLFHGTDDRACRASDSRCAEALAGFDPASFLGGIERDDYQACGAGPIAATMVAARAMGARESHVLCLTNSSETQPSLSGRVVGYLSAAFSEL